MNVQLMIVDPQNDFCLADDGQGNKGSLVVAGADADMGRVAKMITRLGPKIDDIHVTMDSHQTIGIERPTWWKNARTGARPNPFTILGLDGNKIVALNPADMSPTDVEYVTVVPSFYNRTRDYLKALADGKRYPHVVWPIHCVIGTWGWSVVPELSKALCQWEESGFARVNYVVKGNNYFTEHFSAVKAEVPDPKDITTQINTELVKVLEEADIIGICGEALSHCVANTATDIADTFADPKYIQKLVLLTDGSSNVGGYEFLGDAFIKKMVARGMKLSTTTEFLA